MLEKPKGPEQIRAYNEAMWDAKVGEGNRWTKPVSAEVIEEARLGNVSIVLTPHLPVPADWFPPLADCEVLCLAGAGGQQGPVLAAAGAKVTVFDNSPNQLAQDRLVADREGLDLRTVKGDMRDLSAFADACFDLIFYPRSNGFIPARMDSSPTSNLSGTKPFACFVQVVRSSPDSPTQSTASSTPCFVKTKASSRCVIAFRIPTSPASPTRSSPPTAT